MKILHVITGLHNGGAEGALYRLVAFDIQRGNHHIVVSLMDRGIYARRLEEVGANVYCLSMPRGRVTLSGLVQLYRIIKEVKPDTVQTWMYHSDLIGGTIARLAGVRSVVWGIRHANLDPSKNSRMSLRIVKVCSQFSHLIPKKIVSCSVSATAVHQAIGYRADKFVTIPNGYALDVFKPNESVRTSLRSTLKIPPDTFVTGMVARFHEQKDHLNLLMALKLFRESNTENFICILAGTAMSSDNDLLMQQIEEAGLLGQIKLLGPRNDIPAIMASLDLHILSSVGEAFPNVLAEAMACGTPCVSTDVGDAALILGEYGWIVPAQNSHALCFAIQTARSYHLNKIAWRLLQQNCRAHILTNFELAKMAKSYRDVWQQCSASKTDEACSND
ncbi:glycosyltransferase [Alcaligenaceae bacterium]|nr:glycosyltransferase [Alcaligenaceae bacterium]